MAQRQVNPDAIAAELRDSQAAHKLIQKLYVKNLRFEPVVQKICPQPNEQGIQLQIDLKTFTEWLGELDQHQYVDMLGVYQRDSIWRKQQNMEVEGYSIWYRKHIIELSKLKKYYEDEQGNMPIPPTSPQKKVDQVQASAWEIESPQFLQTQSQCPPKKPFVRK